jgi:benzylsuccinate CoA-transferase BbsF subunit
MAGISGLVGWPDRDPVGLGVNIPDYLSALWATIAITSALIQRDATGEGCEIDLSQFQAALSSIGPTITEASLGGTGLDGLGNRAAGCAPHGVYPARGADRWVAVSVLDDDMWQGLCGLEGLAALGDDPRFATLAGRLEHQDDLDDLISGWASGLTAAEATNELQAVGVAASPVASNWEVLAALGSNAVHDMPIGEVHLERPYLHWINSLMPLPWPPSTLVNPASILFERLTDSPPGSKGPAEAPATGSPGP